MPSTQLAPSRTFEVPAALIDRLAQTPRVAVLTGSGLSEESGLPAGRDSFDAVAHPHAPGRNQPQLWAWYERRRAAHMRAQPSAGHLAIAQLAELVPDLGLVTQNVDDLHERAGSCDVLHLNGRLWRARCAACDAAYEHPSGMPDVPADGSLPPPRCSRCTGHVRPDVAWIGEALPEADWIQALRLVNQCEVLLSVGTGALVYPAVEFVHLAIAHGATIVQINPEPTALDSLCGYNFAAPAGVALPALVDALRNRR